MKNLFVFIFISLIMSCSHVNRQKNAETAPGRKYEIEMSPDEYEKGTYGYDASFLRDFPKTVELKNGSSRLLISLKYQGRVMTSSADGDAGRSFGWINHELIGSGEVLPQFNPVGGEERFWLGPEGGQYSLYFKSGSSFDFQNWQVPANIDTEPFEDFEATDSVAVIRKSMEVVNYGNFKFEFDLTRKIELMGKKWIGEKLGITVPENVNWVGYETTNIIENTGEKAWKKETGLISIWLLGMFNPSPSVTMIIPYKTDATSDYIVKDDYFGKIPADRLKIENGIIYFKGDGKQRGKLGIPPQRAMEVIGSYDAEYKVLTLVRCEIPEGAGEYVNSAWEHQKFPYKGDAINAYNDGPLEGGGQLGPFYELESSSPALALQPGAAGQYVQSTYHFEGNEDGLNAICESVFKVSLEKVKSVF